MAQFVAFSPSVEVSGQAIASIVDAIPTGKENRLEILRKHGIDLQKDKWYKQQSYLNAFKEIHDSLGERTLFAIGKSIPEHAKFPPQIDSLEKALGAIELAYQMNHRGGEIGHYRVASFDAKGRKATMVCNTPYASEYDRGIITTMLRRFKPADSIRYDVVTDVSQPSRAQGADSCTYIVTW